MRLTSLNMPLLVGTLLVGMLVAMAVWGPGLAPRDPLVGDATIHLDGNVYGPPPLRPLGPFVSAEYPLGIDTVGRDHWSRLLWSVRPTLVLCAAVVAARLALGIALGLAAGWWGGRVTQVVDPLLAACMAVPLLAVAIALILAVGIERGVPAFVIALAATGWADVAAIVRARAEGVRGAPYIEAAHAIGRRPVGILWHHVLPQLFAILPMLVAFEMSAVLLVVAELGYLGFFIGGGFLYAPVDAGVGPLLTAGTPELGQMLSQFFGLLNRTPWVAISAGLLVFAALAGFTLLGEGLRRRLDITRARRRWGLPFARSRRPRADGFPGSESDAWRIPTGLRWVAAAAGVALLFYAAWRGPQVPASVVEREAAAAALASLEAHGSPAESSPVAPRASDVPAAAPPSAAALSAPVDPSTIDVAALEAALFQPNDLPAGFGASNFRPRAPSSLSGIPKPEAAMTAQLDFNGLNNGRVTALFYPSTEARDTAYTALAAGQSSTVPLPDDWSLPPVGERTAVAQNWTGNVVLFARCGAVVQLNASAPTTQSGRQSLEDAFHSSFEVVLRYAENLDTRLSALACTSRE